MPTPAPSTVTQYFDIFNKGSTLNLGFVNKMSEKEERRAAKKIARSWKKFRERSTTHKLNFTGLEPVMALAMDLERKLVLLLPYVLEGLYPTPVTLETLSDPTLMKQAFDNILWNLSKNVREWSTSLLQTDYSVRLEELAIKCLDQDMNDVVEFSNWCFMNAPTYETFKCLEHLDQVDWDYTLGKSDVPDDSKLHIPTHDIVDSRLVSVPYQLKERRYKYACSPESFSPLSVLGVWSVVESRHDKVVVSDNGTYCQLRLPDNPYLAAFLKADEQKQAVARFLVQRGTRYLQGGDKVDLSKTEDVFIVDEDYQYVSFRKLFQFVSVIIGVTLLALMFSNVTSATKRCTYKARGPDVPECVTDLYALEVNFELPQDTHFQNMQVAGNMLRDRSFLHQLGHVLQGRQLTDDLSVEQIGEETLDVFKNATVGNALVQIVQRSVEPNQQTGLLQAVWAYAVESWRPKAPKLYFNLSSPAQIQQLVAAFSEVQESFTGVNVRDDIISLENLANNLVTKGETMGTLTGDNQFLQIQAQLYALQKTLNVQFEFLNNRYTKVLQSVTNLAEIVESVREEFVGVIANITPSIGATFIENVNPQALVPQDTNFRMSESQYKSKLQQLSYNYRYLLHEVALPLYTLDSNMHTFPERMRARLSEDISSIVNVLKDLMTEMLKFKHAVGLQERNFITRWLESLVGNYEAYDSVKSAKSVTKKVLDLNLEIIEKNKDSYKLLSQVMEKMQDLQSDLRRDYSVAKEHTVTASIQMYSRFVSSSLKLLPSMFGLTDQFFNMVTPYLNVVDIVDDWRARAEESQRNLREKLMFTTRTRFATEVTTGALIDVCNVGLDLIERAKGHLWEKNQGLAAKKIIAVFEYALYFGVSSGQAVRAGVNLFSLGDIPSIEVKPPPLLRDLGLPVLKVSEANLRDWRMPKVELQFKNTTFTIPKFYLRADDTDPNEERKMQIMLEHLIRKYTDYEGPFSMETEVQYSQLTSYLNRKIPTAQ